MTKNSLSDTAALRALLSETSDSNLLAEMLATDTGRELGKRVQEGST